MCVLRAVPRAKVDAREDANDAPACASYSGVSCAVGAVPGCQVPQVWDTQ